MTEAFFPGNEATALIFEIKGNSLDDGPGIRTVVFFKGCPLDCFWCHNPESKKAVIELAYNRDKCIGCDSCSSVCTENAIDRSDTSFSIRDDCTLCFKCSDACPSNALSQIGRKWKVEEVMNEIEKDIPFLSSSGGGITLSGGEPTVYMGFAYRLLMLAKRREIKTLIETCGYFDYDSFNKHIYPYVDTIYYDIKIYDPVLHKKFCGRSNKLILENLEKLSGKSRLDGPLILPRIPLVPGITATKENLIPIAGYLKKLGLMKVGLLQYNPLWASKISALRKKDDLPIDASLLEWMPSSLYDECKEYFSEFSIS